ncbi:hypothetical protein C5167_038179 [Papaver somniferum]|uniref:Uncharacterized protein n=1 Tax=Papaver somniferum TaxID=3469 RepID=A0A4Y7I8E9_PAPSO|nr:hypothetical protein C5167_038179 [Papaver somniferum]
MATARERERDRELLIPVSGVALQGDDDGSGGSKSSSPVSLSHHHSGRETSTFFLLLAILFHIELFKLDGVVAYDAGLSKNIQVIKVVIILVEVLKEEEEKEDG